MPPLSFPPHLNYPMLYLSGRLRLLLPSHPSLYGCQQLQRHIKTWTLPPHPGGLTSSNSPASFSDTLLQHAQAMETLLTTMSTLNMKMPTSYANVGPERPPSTSSSAILTKEGIPSPLAPYQRSYPTFLAQKKG